MMREHCDAEDSAVEWTTQNYGVTTTPEIEWHFVAGKNKDPRIARRSHDVFRSGSRTLGSVQEDHGGKGSPRPEAGDASS
eukprot:1895783-Pyramimonas_sp.AAC.1